MLLQSIYFLVLILFAFYLPGKFLLNIFSVKLENRHSGFAIAFGVGIALFVLSVYSLSFLKLEAFYNIFLIFILIIQGKREIKNLRGSSRKDLPLPEIGIIIIGSILMVFSIALSGRMSGEGMIFYGLNSQDGIYHLSLISNLINNFPPTHPGLSGVPLNGYHFFYDLIVANFVKFYKLDIFHATFVYFPTLVAIFYGVSGFALSKFIFPKRLYSIVFLVLLYFSQGFEFILLPLFGKNPVDFNTGIIQSFTFIINPSVLFSVSIFFIFVVLFFSSKNIKNLILAAILLGVIPEIKVYTGVLAFLAAGIYSMIKILQKEFMYLGFLVVSIAIGCFVYLPLNFGYGGLIFTPFLTYGHFMENSPAVEPLKWPLKMQVYEAYSNRIRILYLYLIAMLLYFIPTLGLRLINLVKIKEIFRKRFYKPENVFWMVSILSGLLITGFFVQTSGVFNTVQFTWIAYILLLIPTAYTITSLIDKLNPSIRQIILLLIILLSLPYAAFYIKTYSSNPFIVDNNLLKTLDKIKTLPKNRSLMVLNVSTDGHGGYNSMYGTTLISGLSGHSTYFEAEVADFSPLHGLIDQRERETGIMGQLSKNCGENENAYNILKENNISYILSLDQSCLKSWKKLNLLTSNGHYELYEFKN